MVRLDGVHETRNPCLKKRCDYWASSVCIGGKSRKTESRWPMIVDKRLNLLMNVYKSAIYRIMT